MKSKAFSIVLSALVAFGLWMYVVTVESPGSEKTYYNIPVVLQNENVLQERGLMITSEVPAVSLTLSGNRTDLNKLDENNINILVNAASIEAAGTHQLNYTVSYPGTVNSSAITRVGQSTNMITLKVEKRITKNVDVVIDYTGAVPEGFIADKDNVLLDYDTVQVSGPESVVVGITQAKLRVDLTDQNATLMGAYVYELCDKNGNPVDAEMVTTNVEKVNLTLKIQRVKEITLVVDTIFGGGVTEQNSTVTVTPATIWISGSDSQLAGLDELTIKVEFEKILKELMQDKDSVTLDRHTLTLPIELPEDATNETDFTEATVEITFHDLKVKRLTVSNFQAINVPEGMEASINQLKIIIGGASGMIDRISASDITVKVDFANAQPNVEASFPVTITIIGQHSDVSVVGTYSVLAKLDQPDVQEE